MGNKVTHLLLSQLREMLAVNSRAKLAGLGHRHLLPPLPPVPAARLTLEVLHERESSPAQYDGGEQDHYQSRGDQNFPNLVIELQVERERVSDGSSEP